MLIMFEKKSTVYLFVGNMMCEHCAAHINGALKAVDGIKKINIDLPSKTVCVSYVGEKTTPENMISVLKAEGYDAEIKL